MIYLFFEFGQLAHWDERRLLGCITDIEGRSLLEQCLEDGRGILLLVPHYGNWELLCAYLGRNHTLAALYDPPKLESLEPVIKSAREKYQGQMFAIDTAGMRSLVKVLKEGKLITILPDQVPERGAGGVYADFFGHPALTMTFTHRLIQRHNPHVLMGSVQRLIGEQGMSYRLCFEALDQSVYEKDEAMSARAMNAAVEGVVMRDPVQYQWEYKRFKRPPEGQANIYRRQ